MGELNAKVGQRLRDELPGVYKRVLARSAIFVKDPRVLATLGGNAGTAADDLVHEAVMRILDGRRNWDPDKVGLEHYLVQAVRSIADSYKRQGHLRGPTYDDGIGQGDCVNLIAQPVLNSSQVLEAREVNEDLENQLITAAGDDVELLQLVDALMSGAYLPRELAADLDWDIKKVNVLKRKLKRRVVGAGENRQGSL